MAEANDLMMGRRELIAERYALLVHDGANFYTYSDRKQAEMAAEKLEALGQSVSVAVIDYETKGKR